MEDDEENIGDERALHGDLHPELVCGVELPCEADMFVHGAEPALDAGVLVLVVGLDFAGFGCPFARSKEGCEAIAVTRATSGLEGLELAGGFQTRG